MTQLSMDFTGTTLRNEGLAKVAANAAQDTGQAEMTGNRYGKHTVIGEPDEKHYVLCRCDCGTVKKIYKWSLLRGMSKSCGCNRVKHGRADTSLYIIWSRMKERCLNPNHIHFHNYGGRGITVCEKWLHDFQAFSDDVGTRPSPRHQIDRIDNEGNYEPGNVKWSTIKEQANNKRGCVTLTHNGQTKNIMQWAESMGMLPSTIYYRHHRGWPVEKILANETIPHNERRHGHNAISREALI